MFLTYAYLSFMQHIEDLTQEKFSLQRALEASRALAESLAAENSSLTDSYNQQVARPIFVELLLSSISNVWLEKNKRNKEQIVASLLGGDCSER